MNVCVELKVLKSPVLSASSSSARQYCPRHRLYPYLKSRARKQIDECVEVAVKNVSLCGFLWYWGLKLVGIHVWGVVADLSEVRQDNIIEEIEDMSCVTTTRLRWG